MSDQPPPSNTPDAEAADAVLTTPAEDASLLERTLFEVKKVIVGQDRMIERMLVAVLSRGHCLLEGVPGVAKTLAVETLATVVGGSFARIQFTPDLVPADIMGTRIYRTSSEKFDVELGPVFVNFLLADEINRAPAKVQSALLEVMAEQQVSIGGTTYEVPRPFLVMATQNPIEQEGVYPLPEAQRDRFLLKIVVGYPTDVEEREIVYRVGVRIPTPAQVLDPTQLIRLQDKADAVFVHNALVDYAVRLVVATREPAAHGVPDVAPLIQYGASPRASLGIVRAARALALMRGRDYTLPQDLADIAPDVLRHRLVLSYDALADDIPADRIVDRIIQSVPLPTVAPRQSAAARPTDFILPPAAPTRRLRCPPGRGTEVLSPRADSDRTSGGGTHSQHGLPLHAERADATLNRLQLVITRRLDGLLQGDYLGLLPGPGSEAGESREYRPGDDVRRMDWPVTARTTVAHVRRTIADRELETWLAVDLSASLDFGSAGSLKRDLAIAAAASVAHLTVRGGNRIGAVVGDGRSLVRLPARLGSGRGPGATACDRPDRVCICGRSLLALAAARPHRSRRAHRQLEPPATPAWAGGGDFRLHGTAGPVVPAAAQTRRAP